MYRVCSARSYGEYQKKKKSLEYGPLKEVDQMLEHLLLSVRKYVDTLRILICKKILSDRGLLSLLCREGNQSLELSNLPKVRWHKIGI